jgi:hypothetical protein
VAGGVYKRLTEQRFFSAKTTLTPTAFVMHPAPAHAGIGN